MEENKKNKIPNVPNLRFPFFSSQWIKIKIGDYYDVQMCRRIFANQTKEYGDVPFYKIGTLGNNADAYISKELFEEYKKKYNYPIIGETLITCSGTVGRCVQFDGNPSYYQDSNIVWLRKKSDLIIDDFLFRLIQQKDWSKLNTTTISRIYNADLLSLRFYIPASNKEQEKIARFLDLIDERIRTQSKIIDKLESLKIQIKERIFNLGTIKKTISDVLIENNKKSIIQDQYPVLSSTVKGLFLQSDYFEREVASSNNIGYKIVKKGQIIISPQNLWMGNITYNDTFENGIVSPSYKVFDITTKYFKNYIYWILTSKHSFFNFSLVSEQGASIVRRNLNYDSFLNLTLPLCDEEQQKHISKLIDLIETKLKLEKRKFELFLNQKNYLLSNLFI